MVLNCYFLQLQIIHFNTNHEGAYIITYYFQNLSENQQHWALLKAVSIAFTNQHCTMMLGRRIWNFRAVIIHARYKDHTCDRVGTAVGSKSSQLLGSIGTQTRPRKKQISNKVHCVTKIQTVLRIVQLTHQNKPNLFLRIIQISVKCPFVLQSRGFKWTCMYNHPLLR
jgi:hypothetical protein